MQVRIRPLASDEIEIAFEVMKQLRTHLDSEAFSARVHRQSALGYELVGAFDAAILVAVMGMRRVETLARGQHLHVDDLVVRDEYRGRGIGSWLLDHAEQRVQREGLSGIFLDSRREVIEFYRRRGFESHTAHLMCKSFGS